MNLLLDLTRFGGYRDIAKSCWWSQSVLPYRIITVRVLAIPFEYTSSQDKKYTMFIFLTAL